MSSPYLNVKYIFIGNFRQLAEKFALFDELIKIMSFEMPSITLILYRIVSLDTNDLGSSFT